MIPIADRVAQQGFTAYAAAEIFDDLWPRVERLVTSGRRIIYVERWLDGHGGSMKVVPGQTLETRGFVPGAHYRSGDDSAGFQIALAPGIEMLGMSADARDGSETDAVRRFHEKRDATRIRVEGFGLGYGDHIEITDYNDHGVGWQRCLYFDYESHGERAQREAALVRALAARGPWIADDLLKLAHEIEFYQDPAADLAARMRTETEP